MRDYHDSHRLSHTNQGNPFILKIGVQTAGGVEPEAVGVTGVTVEAGGIALAGGDRGAF